MRRAFGVVAVVALVLPAVTAGKGQPTDVRVCGLDRCAHVSLVPEFLDALSGRGAQLATAGVPPVGRFYRVKLSDKWGYAGEGWFVPGGSVLRIGERWYRISAADAALLRAAGRRVSAFRRPRFVAVRVGGRRAAAPARYLDLYRRLPKAPLPQVGDGHWFRIHIRAAAPNPWTSGRQLLEYLPAKRVLFRGGEWVRVPAPLAARIARDGGVGGSGSGLLVPGALAALLLVAALVYRLRNPTRTRRRIRERWFGLRSRSAPSS